MEEALEARDSTEPCTGRETEHGHQQKECPRNKAFWDETSDRSRESDGRGNCSRVRDPADTHTQQFYAGRGASCPDLDSLAQAGRPLAGRRDASAAQEEVSYKCCLEPR